MEEERPNDEPQDDGDAEPQAAPEPVMETGRIQIVVGLDGDGKIQRSWGIIGMTSYEALGHLDVLAGLIKNIEMGTWARGMGSG